MAWQTPKTDWAVRYDTDGHYTGDYFGAGDYQRIRGNLLYLAEQAAGTLHMDAGLPDIPDVTDASFGYAGTINALERSLDALLDAGAVDLGLEARKSWQANRPAPLAEDLNRIERSCLLLQQALENQAAMRPKLAISLGKGAPIWL